MSNVKIERKEGGGHVVSNDAGTQRTQQEIRNAVSEAIFMAGPQDTIEYDGRIYTPKTIVSILPPTKSSHGGYRPGAGAKPKPGPKAKDLYPVRAFRLSDPEHRKMRKYYKEEILSKRKK